MYHPTLSFILEQSKRKAPAYRRSFSFRLFKMEILYLQCLAIF